MWPRNIYILDIEAWNATTYNQLDNPIQKTGMFSMHTT